MKPSLIAIVLLVTATPAAADVSIVDNRKTLTHDCAKDKRVELIGNHITLTLVGTCELVTVTGNNETVRGSATKFYIAGNKNTVEAAAADEIYVAGSKNTVTWKQGLTRKVPTIANPGKDNKVTQTR
jgi:hypothetical protein